MVSPSTKSTNFWISAVNAKDVSKKVASTVSTASPKMFPYKVCVRVKIVQLLKSEEDIKRLLQKSIVMNIVQGQLLQRLHWLLIVHSPMYHQRNEKFIKCGSCKGCLATDYCGTCSFCTHPNPISKVLCLQRRCKNKIVKEVPILRSWLMTQQCQCPPSTPAPR